MRLFLPSPATRLPQRSKSERWLCLFVSPNRRRSEDSCNVSAILKIGRRRWPVRNVRFIPSLPRLLTTQAYPGGCVIKPFLQPNGRVEPAQTQVVSTVTAALRPMPPGIFPPNVVKYDASSVPVLQLGLGSKTLSEQDLFDYGNNFIKMGL